MSMLPERAACSARYDRASDTLTLLLDERTSDERSRVVVALLVDDSKHLVGVDARDAWPRAPVVVMLGEHEAVAESIESAAWIYAARDGSVEAIVIEGASGAIARPELVSISS